MATTDKTSVARAFPAQGPHSQFAGGGDRQPTATAGATEIASPAPISAGPISLLLVDSQPEDIERHRQMLHEQFAGDVQIHGARTAAQALALLAQRPIDVVLSEYLLPDADGLGLLASIAARHPHVATMILTAHGSETVAAKSLQLGARGYLAKRGLSAGALARGIRQAARLAQLERQQFRQIEQLRRSHEDLEHFVQVLSHDMPAMFLLLDHSFQRLKETAEGDASDAARAAPAVPSGAAGPSPIGGLAQRFAHVDACMRESKRFLDDLVTFARTGRIQMDPMRCDLAACVQEVLFEQRELLGDCERMGTGSEQFAVSALKERGGEVPVPILSQALSPRRVEVDVAADLPTVWCNPARVKQVLTNLVRNALKHGCDARRPRIAIARHAAGELPGEPWIWIAVSDNGPGIPPESREDIFLPGRRLTGAHPEGSGMGLPIVRKIVEHYGGRVFVDPSEHSGTAIIFSLPSPPADGNRR